MITRNNIKRGDIISYKKEIMFKGIEMVKSKVIAIRSSTALLENGDEISIF